MSDEELLSIIIPVYNTKKYLRQCVDSVLNQEYKNIEVILVDDGSIDGSGEICDIYQQIDERVRVFHQKNEGCISARFRGIENSNGGYIGFVDSDDWIAPDMYRILMYEALRKKCDIVTMGYVTVLDGVEKKKDDATLFGVYESGKNLDILLSNMMYDEEKGNRGIHPALWSKIIKKRLLVEAVTGINKNITIGEDAAIFYPCCLHSDRICVLQEHKYYYRIHNHSMCRSIDINSISKIYIFHQYMQKVFFLYSGKYNLLKQLKKYSWEFIKTFGLAQVFDICVGKAYVFPYALINKGSNIILYGAGGVGQAYYNQIQDNHYCNIVAWVDRHRGNREKVMYPEQMLTLQYSKVVIAVKKKEVAEEIKRELIAIGIKKEKIMWVHPQEISPDIM